MARRGREVSPINLPEWSKEDQWFRQEAIIVPIEESSKPWYMEQSVPVAEAHFDAIELRYFRSLVSLLDESSWQDRDLPTAVESWLARHDHYRFVAAVRPLNTDWYDILVDIGVSSARAMAVVREISSQLKR